MSPPGPPRPRGSSARPGRALPSPYLAVEGWAGRLALRLLPWTWRAAARCPSAPLQRELRLRSHHCAPSGCVGCTDALSGPPLCTGSARVRMRTRPPSHLARCPRTAWARCAGPSRTRVCVTPQPARACARARTDARHARWPPRNALMASQPPSDSLGGVKCAAVLTRNVWDGHVHYSL